MPCSPVGWSQYAFPICIKYVDLKQVVKLMGKQHMYALVLRLLDRLFIFSCHSLHSQI